MKTILITGSTDGIGKLAAQQLANKGHQIIIHGRNLEKLKSAKNEIINSTGNQNIFALEADLSDINQVVGLAKNISDKISSIDVLINNAGVFKSSIQTNKKGLDIRFVVNYLAPFVLTNELMPILLKSKAKVINLSSAAQAPVSLEALNGSESIDVQSAYAQSKLALTMWSFYLAKTEPILTTVAVNPGSLLNTKMVQEAYGQYWDTPEKGANILTELSLSKSNNNGKYFDNDQGVFSNSHQDAYHEQKTRQLISETNKILKK